MVNIVLHKRHTITVRTAMTLQVLTGTCCQISKDFKNKTTLYLCLCVSKQEKHICCVVHRNIGCLITTWLPLRIYIFAGNCFRIWSITCARHKCNVWPGVLSISNIYLNNYFRFDYTSCKLIFIHTLQKKSTRSYEVQSDWFILW